jgi:hypothetical protein
LSEGQRVLLREFIENTNGSFRKHVVSIVPTLKAELMKFAPRVKDSVIRIKLTEVARQLDQFTKGRDLKDDQVQSLLSYYQLVDELKKLK